MRFAGHPATISHVHFDGLTFFLDPSDCAYSPGERDDATGLAPVDLTCEELGELRDSATVSITGTLRLPADMAGVRGDLPETGGQLSVGDETRTFAEARLDLRRPEVIETRPGFTTRNPVLYPVSIVGSDAELEFEYDGSAPDLRLLAIAFDERRGEVPGDGCQIAYRTLAELSPRVEQRSAAWSPVSRPRRSVPTSAAVVPACIASGAAMRATVWLACSTDPAAAAPAACRRPLSAWSSPSAC